MRVRDEVLKYPAWDLLAQRAPDPNYVVDHIGHVDGGRAFGHPFDKGLRFHKSFIIPYPYYDYNPTDAFDDYPSPDTSLSPDTSVVPPPPLPSACHRSEETFTVRSEGGGTRRITIVNCP
jgi:hypothetical protein